MSDEAFPGTRWSRHVANPYVVLATSFTIKCVIAWMVRDMDCVSDECTYLRLARGIVEDGHYPLVRGEMWAPGQAFFLALSSWAFGGVESGARLLQILASTLTAFIVYKTAEHIYDRRVALVALVIVAFYPNLVFFSHTLWPETNYLLWFCLAVLVLLQTPLSARRAVLSGCLFGIASYFKGVGLYFVPLAGFWAVATGRATTRVGVLLVVAALATITPWTVRNYLTFDRLLLLDATLGSNMTMGLNNKPPPSYDWGGRPNPQLRGGRKRCRLPNVVDRDRCDIVNGLKFIKRNPERFLHLVPLKWADLLSPTSFLIRHVRKGSYPYEFGPGEIQVITVLSAGGWMAVAILGLLGLTAVRGRQELWLIWLLITYHGLVTVFTIGMSRLRLPFVPYLVIVAAAACLRAPRAGSGEISASQTNWVRWTVFAGATGGLVWLWSQTWYVVFDVL